jgi:hypothetical protein
MIEMNENEPLENLYFNWLCAKVIKIRYNRTSSTTYWRLFRTLHNTEYIWLVSMDDNRLADGKHLRREFIRETGIDDDLEWREITPCSLFEMLIAFSIRCEFQASDLIGNAQHWFWKFIYNLGLTEANDASDITEEQIGEVLHRFIWRTYDYSGKGGIFPLDDPRQDQRKVEVFYQLFDYLTDLGLMQRH